LHFICRAHRAQTLLDQHTLPFVGSIGSR
jgi:hypothetical protein